MKVYYGYSDKTRLAVTWDEQHQILTITCPPGTAVTCADQHDGVTPTVVNIFQKD